MRILHTADWHLGRLFYNNRLVEDQAKVLEHQWPNLLQEEKIDVVVIAGDVFDRAVPAVEAVELWDKALHDLAFTYRIPAVIISGNHDNGTRLAAGKSFYAQQGVHLIGDVQAGLRPIYLEDEHGPVAFCPMAYEEPGAIFDALGVEESVPDFGLAQQHWVDVLQQEIQGVRSVGIAHAFVAGSWSTESERPLRVGGKDQVPSSVFADFHYTALGHLHGPQRAGAAHIRYAGSLLPYSFDEASHTKSFTIVDMDAKGAVRLTEIPVDVPHPVRIIKDSFDGLLANTTLQAECETSYILAQLTDAAPVMDGFARLRQAYPNLQSLEYVRNPRGTAADAETEAPAFRALSDQELLGRLAQAAWGEDLDEEQAAYMDSVWNRVQEAP